ncbi:MAG: hypothetical protein JST63_08385 [Bacteroidetes bacterium]|nr:hypothetical protein [Bacteroidota bacterium]
MKYIKTHLLLVCLLFWGLNGMAQRIKVIEGKIPAMKDVNTEFTYDNISIGKYDKEEDYIKAKKDEYNKKEPGKGDSWAIKWKDDREQRFQPKFDELLSKYGELTLNKNAKYTIIFHTQFMEPGFNIGITRKNAYINGEALIVETADKSKVVAKVTIEKAPGNSYWGNDFDTGERLSETYATAGKALGKLIKKEQ